MDESEIYLDFDDLVLAEENDVQFDAGNSEMCLCRYRGELFVLKLYAPEYLQSLDPEALAALVLWPSQLDSADRVRLARVAAWPRRIVLYRGAVAGVLLPFAGQRFLGRTRAGSLPRTLEWLIGPQDTHPIEAVLHTLATVVDHVLWLHGCGVVISDLQSSNVLVDLTRREPLFVDCDSMVVLGRHVSAPLAPDMMRQVWPPAVAADEMPSVATDFARLAWIVVWCCLRRNDIKRVTDQHRGRLSELMSSDAVNFLFEAMHLSSHGPEHNHQWRRLVAEWRPTIGHPRPADHDAVRVSDPALHLGSIKRGGSGVYPVEPLGVGALRHQRFPGDLLERAIDTLRTAGDRIDPESRQETERKQVTTQEMELEQAYPLFGGAVSMGIAVISLISVGLLLALTLR